MTADTPSSAVSKGLVAIMVLVVVVLGAGIGYLLMDRPSGADPSDARLVGLGRTVYAEHCADCHGANLEGKPAWREPNPDGSLPAPPHDESGHTWHHSDDILFEYTKRGGKAVVPDFNSRMPGFADKLSDEEIWAVLAFIKSRWPAQVQARQERLNKP